MKNFSLLRASCALPERACKISYFESFRDLNVPQCCQLDARAKHPEVFSLCEPEHLPVPEVHGKEVHRRHSNPQFGKDDYAPQGSIDIHLKQKRCIVWQSLDLATHENLSVGGDTWNTIQRKAKSYKLSSSSSSGTATLNDGSM